MSAKVWSGDITTQPMPSRKAARITGVPPGSPTATAFRSRSIRTFSRGTGGGP